MSTKFRFLGTGGGRFSTVFQSRATGSIYLGIGIHIGAESVIKGIEGIGPPISKYHLSLINHKIMRGGTS